MQSTKPEAEELLGDIAVFGVRYHTFDAIKISTWISLDELGGEKTHLLRGKSWETG